MAAALAVRQARRFDARSIAWKCPEHEIGASAAAGITAGTILGSYRFDRFKSRRDDDAPDRPELEVADARSAPATRPGSPRSPGSPRRPPTGPATCRTSRPTSPTPRYVAERAREIAAAHESIEVEVLGPAELEREGMGGMLAVAAGSEKDPALIVLRYSGGGDAAGAAEARLRRQDGDVRHRRHLPEAGGRHAGHEDGHVGRRRGARGDGRDRRARPADRPDLGAPGGREHARAAARPGPATSSPSSTASRSRSTTPTPRGA